MTAVDWFALGGGVISGMLISCLAIRVLLPKRPADSSERGGQAGIPQPNVLT